MVDPAAFEQGPRRRPGLTWQPRRCFGTKRGVFAVGHVIAVVNRPANNHRQVEPGLRQ
ncbi:DUF1589 domain-containing protein [Rhodopirellula sp. P2]|uniref:DUF1589 domain-containing protein n=1 Tax=Rhodopirellula sp. P2 TaxID=2127060 RepID=UPI003FD319D9